MSSTALSTWFTVESAALIDWVPLCLAESASSSHRASYPLERVLLERVLRRARRRPSARWASWVLLGLGVSISMTFLLGCHALYYRARVYQPRPRLHKLFVIVCITKPPRQVISH